MAAFSVAGASLARRKSVTRQIVFNGQEYASAEAMPEGVRQAYQQALALLADADQNGIPDILERGTAGNVITIHHSVITVNGRTYNGVGDMPAAVRRVYEQAMAEVDENPNSLPGALEAALSGLATPPSSAGAVGPELPQARDAPALRHPLDQLSLALDTLLRILLGIVAVAIMAGAVVMMVSIDGGPGSQGGRWYVAVAALLLLGAVDSQYAWLLRRREPLSLTESPGYRRYRIGSLLLLLAAAVVLLGLAWLLP
jgi:hypothetical protein